jgi:hypothetical protein
LSPPTDVHRWIEQIFAGFRELELQLLIGQLESSLRSGSQDGVRQTGQARRPVT